MPNGVTALTLTRYNLTHFMSRRAQSSMELRKTWLSLVFTFQLRARSKRARVHVWLIGRCFFHVRARADDNALLIFKSAKRFRHASSSPTGPVLETPTHASKTILLNNLLPFPSCLFDYWSATRRLQQKAEVKTVITFEKAVHDYFFHFSFFRRE